MDEFRFRTKSLGVDLYIRLKTDIPGVDLV